MPESGARIRCPKRRVPESGGARNESVPESGARNESVPESVPESEAASEPKEGPPLCPNRGVLDFTMKKQRFCARIILGRDWGVIGAALAQVRQPCLARAAGCWLLLLLGAQNVSCPNPAATVEGRKLLRWW